MARGGIGSCFFADVDELLRVLVLQSCIVFGLYLCFLLIVSAFGFFEDVDEMFALGELAKLRSGVVERTYG
jgi:hypothetical protein